MSVDILLTLTVVAALGSGLVAGVLFTFSTFVMKALGRLPEAQGIAAMQSINIVVINPFFMLAFFGTALVCVAVAAFAALEPDEPAMPYQLAGSALYIFGTVLVTAAFNIPRNNALAGINPDKAESAGPWRRYLGEWTAWNHVRTAAALGAMALLTIAAVEM